MSIKHRVKDRDTTGKMRPLFRVWREQVSREYRPRPAFYDTYKNPSWWNRLVNNKPKRREARHLCRLITGGKLEADAAIFPVNRKPYDYFW